MDSHDFALTIVHKVGKYADDLESAVFSHVKGKMKPESLIPVFQSLMWKEYFLGVPPPSKQIVLLPDRDLDIKIMLADQITDELRHSRAFSERVKALGGNGSLLEYQPSEEDLQMYRATYDYEDPVEIAASLQIAGEPALNMILNRLAQIADETTARMIRQIQLDEGRHIKIGQLILQRHATTPEKQRRVEEIVDRKYEALYASHGRAVRLALRSSTGKPS
ncbi:MAG: ferritin-like domain-containing protein [Acidobacteria bacterium]|nr:ferritin-like domain-containing protein [Acidobacteriota bacterium]